MSTKDFYIVIILIIKIVTKMRPTISLIVILFWRVVLNCDKLVKQRKHDCIFKFNLFYINFRKINSIVV